MEYTKPFATSVKPLACSESLLGTSNCVFSDWGIRSTLYFYQELPYIGDNKIKCEFEILSSWYVTEKWKILFKSSDWCEIQKWIEDHESEIVEQINKKSIDWIKNYYPNRLNEFVPESINL